MKTGDTEVKKFIFVFSVFHKGRNVGALWYSFNPFRSYVEPCPKVLFSCSVPMSEDVRHGFCCVCSPPVGACPTLFLM
jgi:hypothetical protein